MSLARLPSAVAARDTCRAEGLVGGGLQPFRQELSCQAYLVVARLRAIRYRELVAIQAVSEQDHDDAEATRQQAEAGVAADRAAVRRAQIDLDYTRVVSPISGCIGRSSVTAGALVTAS